MQHFLSQWMKKKSTKKYDSLVYANLFNSEIIYLQLMTDTKRWGKNMRYWYEYNI